MFSKKNTDWRVRVGRQVLPRGILANGNPFFRFGKRGLLEKGSFQKSPFSRDSRDFRYLEILENPQTVENKGESEHFLEILENLEIFEILEKKKDAFRNDPFFRSRVFQIVVGKCCRSTLFEM